AAAVDRSLLGYNNLSGLLANGAGVPVAQVEVFNPGTADYGPDTSNLTLYPGKTFTPLSGFTGVSPHANEVGSLFYGHTASTASDAHTQLLATSYNGVTVGTRTGSFGPVTFDAAGAQIKPDLIVDTGTTSDATALASGAATLIRSEARARGLPAGELATKAIL